LDEALRGLIDNTKLRRGYPLRSTRIIGRDAKFKDQALTAYVPVEWLKKGRNEIVVLELIKSGQDELHSIEKPILNMLGPSP